MYRIKIRREAKRKLQGLSVNERMRITEKIMILASDPDDATLDIKKLVNVPYYRLRIGSWRVIYARDDFLKVIGIERIKPRGDAYK